MGRKYLLILIFFGSPELMAQEKPVDSISAGWKFSAWADWFILPDEKDFVNPTFYARYKNLHLEGRYNYEDQNTTSLWAGRRFEFGKGVKFVFIPMGGIVFGNTDGIAPGLEMEISYGKFDFYSESEYLFDFSGKENNFFYSYSELAIRPIKPIRTGMVAQKTKLIESTLEIQRGLFAEYYYKRFRVGFYYFSPFSSNNFWISSFSVDF